MSIVLRDHTYQEILDKLSIYRDFLLNTEVITDLSGDREVVSLNDDRTKTALASKRNTINNQISIDTMAFEARNGWFDFSYSDYQDLEISLDIFTQSVFDAQRIIVENHQNSPYNSWDAAKSDFDDILGGL